MIIRLTQVSRPSRVAVAGLLALTLGLAACSSSKPSAAASTSTGTASGSASSGTNSLHAMLPAAIQSSGVIRVGSTFGYPPDEFYDDNNNATGISVDLANALGTALGVKFEFSNITFDSIIPGLLAGRYDTIIGALAVTPARLKQFDMLTYQNSGGAIVVPGGNPANITGVGDLCGRTVAMLKGAHFIQQLDQLNQSECVAQHKPAIKQSIYDQSADTYQAVAAKRADATYAAYDVAKYSAAHSNGALGYVDHLYPDVPYGAAFTPANKQLAQAIQAALQQIIENGDYAKVLDKWGVSNEAVTTADLQLTSS